MKYKHLLNTELLSKLLHVAFKRAGANHSVYKYYSETKHLYEFIEHEINKINAVFKAELQNENSEEKRKEIIEKASQMRNEILDIDTECSEVLLNLSVVDFQDGGYTQPPQTEMWLTGLNINSVIDFVNRQKERAEK